MFLLRMFNQYPNFASQKGYGKFPFLLRMLLNKKEKVSFFLERKTHQKNFQHFTPAIWCSSSFINIQWREGNFNKLIMKLFWVGGLPQWGRKGWGMETTWICRKNLMKMILSENESINLICYYAIILIFCFSFWI